MTAQVRYSAPAPASATARPVPATRYHRRIIQGPELLPEPPGDTARPASNAPAAGTALSHGSGTCTQHARNLPASGPGQHHPLGPRGTAAAPSRRLKSPKTATIWSRYSPPRAATPSPVRKPTGTLASTASGRLTVARNRAATAVSLPTGSVSGLPVTVGVQERPRATGPRPAARHRRPPLAQGDQCHTAALIQQNNRLPAPATVTISAWKRPRMTNEARPFKPGPCRMGPAGSPRGLGIPTGVNPCGATGPENGPAFDGSVSAGAGILALVPVMRLGTILPVSET